MGWSPPSAGLFGNCLGNSDWDTWCARSRIVIVNLGLKFWENCKLKPKLRALINLYPTRFFFFFLSPSMTKMPLLLRGFRNPKSFFILTVSLPNPFSLHRTRYPCSDHFSPSDLAEQLLAVWPRRPSSDRPSPTTLLAAEPFFARARRSSTRFSHIFSLYFFLLYLQSSSSPTRFGGRLVSIREFSSSWSR